MVYIYQLITIYQIDITEPIIRTQEEIVSLKNFQRLGNSNSLSSNFLFATTFGGTKNDAKQIGVFCNG